MLVITRGDLDSGIGRLLVISELLGGVHQREAVASDRLATIWRRSFVQIVSTFFQPKVEAKFMDLFTPHY